MMLAGFLRLHFVTFERFHVKQESKLPNDATYNINSIMQIFKFTLETLYFNLGLILKNLSRELVHKSLEKKGVQLSGYVYELPLHKQPVFPDYNKNVLSMTEYVCSKHICLPIYPTLQIEEAEYIANSLIELF